jgi:deoxyribonuclease-4
VRIGIHLSIARGLDQAAHRAVAIGANAFQIFSASPRMWRQTMPDADSIRRLAKLRAEFDLHPLVIHDNYLINLAAHNPSVRAQSIAAFRAEIERALAIGAEYLVLHPGSYRGYTLPEGLEAVADGLSQAAAGLHSDKLTLLLENTAGAGCTLGSKFEELAALRRLVVRRLKFAVGFCIDTQHCHAAGYDITSVQGLRNTLKQLEATLGLEQVPVLHVNDSKAPFGSHLDRHQHIGEGYIGKEAFARIVNHRKLRSKTFILETPVDHPDDDERNLRVLKSLVRLSRR